MTGILGREFEIAAIDEFLQARAGGARTLVLQGEPGIGKTTLWRWAAANAESHGLRVLRAQPTEAEQELAFATLGDLLSSVHDEIGALPEPQRRALRIALLLEEPDGRILDERVVGTAFANLLREAARDSVALVAIDDVQWADASSWACIRFALRRLDVRVAALLTCRSGFALDSSRSSRWERSPTRRFGKSCYRPRPKSSAATTSSESRTLPAAIRFTRSRLCASALHVGASTATSPTP